MKLSKKNIVITIFSILPILFFIFFFSQTGSPEDSSTVKGNVVKILDETGKTFTERYGNIEVKIIEGSHKGQTVTVQNMVDEVRKGESTVHLGNEVLLHIDENKDGTIKSGYILEIIRYNLILWVSALFLLLLILIGGKKGVKSVLTLLISLFVIIEILLPLIIAGFDPVPVTIIICLIVVVLNMLILMGKNKRTLAAIIGIAGGLIISGLLAYYVTYQLNLKGIDDEQLQMLIYTSKNANFNFSGLLLSGIILGSLGVIMDVSISIVSAMYEVLNQSSTISRMDLIRSGMNVGKDIMGSMTNTLVFAYVGSGMYTLLMAISYGLTLSSIINQDVIASEMIKTLAGSIGLVLTIPLTAIVTGLFLKEKIDN